MIKQDYVKDVIQQPLYKKERVKEILLAIIFMPICSALLGLIGFGMFFL